MAQTSVQLDNFFAIQWGAPEPRDVEEVVGKVTAQRERCGRPLAYLALMGDDTARLSQEGRDTLMKLTERVLPHCDRLVVVIEAQGFAASILRSALTAFTLLSGRRNTLFYESDVETGLAKLSGSMTIDPDEARGVISELRAKHRAA